MEHLPENSVAEASVEQLEAPTTQVRSVGTQLREGREKMGLSVEDVVNRIKLAPRQIVALEADDFTGLPETAFLRGFVRSYARLLQLDVQPLLDALPGSKPEVQAEVAKRPLVETPFPTERTARRPNVNLLIAALLLALAIAGFSVWQFNAPHPEKIADEHLDAAAGLVATPLNLADQLVAESAVAESTGAESAVGENVVTGNAAEAEKTVPVVAAPAAVPAVAPAAHANATLRLTFDKESWVDVQDYYGKTLSRQLNQPGSELHVEGLPPFSLVIGHAAAVHLYLRDKPVDLSSYVNASSDVARLTLE